MKGMSHYAARADSKGAVNVCQRCDVAGEESKLGTSQYGLYGVEVRES